MYCAIVLIYYSHVLNKVSCYTVLEESCCDTLQCTGFMMLFLWLLTLKVLVATTDAQWEGMGDIGSARYELALLPPCPTLKVLSYSN